MTVKRSPFYSIYIHCGCKFIASAGEYLEYLKVIYLSFAVINSAGRKSLASEKVGLNQPRVGLTTKTFVRRHLAGAVSLIIPLCSVTTWELPGRT